MSLPGPVPSPVPAHPMPWASADAMAWVHGLGGLAWHCGGPHSASQTARRDGSRGTARARCQHGGEVAAGAGRGGRFQKETGGKKNIAQQGTRLA
jgi:hypothetical protein